MSRRLSIVHLASLVLLILLTAAIADEAKTFRLDGDFFTPSPENEIKTWDIPVPDGRVFERIVVELDVTVGQWWANNSDGVHNLFWLTRQGIWRSNTVGYVNLFGPGRNRLKQMTNLELGKGQVRAETVPFAAESGHTYHVAYTYDCAEGRITTALTENGSRKALAEMEATASQIQTKGGFHQLRIGLNEKYNECPTVGWTYSNLRIKFLPEGTAGRKRARGPLTIHSANGRYFDDGTGRAVLLVGVNHGWELQDDSWGTRYTLDWPAFLDYLGKHNLNYIRLWRPQYLMILPGDHIAKLDLAGMLRFHERRRAKVTIMVTRPEEMRPERYGLIRFDRHFRITHFEEKPGKVISPYISIGVSPVGSPKTEFGLLNTWRATIRAASSLIS